MLLSFSIPQQYSKMTLPLREHLLGHRLL